MSWSKISRDNFATFGISSLALTLAVACGTARESEIPSEGSTTAAQQPANQQSAAQPTVAQSASGGAVPTTLLQTHARRRRNYGGGTHGHPEHRPQRDGGVLTASQDVGQPPDLRHEHCSHHGVAVHRQQ